MSKFDNFNNDEVIILANALSGEADRYRDMINDNIDHAGARLDVITGLAEDLLAEVGDRKAIALAEMDQLIASLRDNDE